MIARKLLWLSMFLLAACGGEAPPDGTAANTAAAARTPSAPGATVFFVSPLSGASVQSPVTVKFGISGMAVSPAGTYGKDTGHHHVLVDTQLQNDSAPLPSDANHVHFGKGQTETTLELAAGNHTLQLVLGDGNHIPHEPPVVSDPITITVE